MQKRSFKVVLSENDSGGFTVTVPALPGCVTQGANREEALEHAHEAIEGFLEALAKEGLPMGSDVVIDEVQVSYGSRQKFHECMARM